MMYKYFNNSIIQAFKHCVIKAFQVGSNPAHAGHFFNFFQTQIRTR